MAELSSFSDPVSVARYADGPMRMVPGFHGLQRMAAVLLAERVKYTRVGSWWRARVKGLCRHAAGVALLRR